MAKKKAKEAVINYFWEYRIKRKNEEKRNDLPKSKISKRFSSKVKAIEYTTDKKNNWLQAALFKSSANGFIQIASINTKGNFSEKFF